MHATEGESARIAELTGGVDRWLQGGEAAEPWRGLAVRNMRRASVGYSSETYLVDLATPTGSAIDTPGLVLRLAPSRAVHRGDALVRQVEVQQALAAHAIPVPAPAVHEPDADWLGAAFVTMPLVAGHVAGEVPAIDEWITSAPPDAQAALYDELTAALIQVHALDLTPVALPSVPGAVGAQLDDVEVWRDYLMWATDGEVPSRLGDALDWCVARRPAVSPPSSLRWGDARLGNAIFDEDRHLLALIDWETASVGPAELDIGYWLGLEAVLDDVMGRRVDGFPDRAGTVRRVERGLGRPLVDLRWFEVLGLVSAAAITVRLDVLRKGRPTSDARLAAHPVVQRLERLIAEAAGGGSGTR
jgi:aminoglycoside phosphotransferase (APT) family kinase protein